MGPYCNECGRRCFVPFPQATPQAALDAYPPGVTIIATCLRGQEKEMARTGWHYASIQRLIRQGANERERRDRLARARAGR